MKKTINFNEFKQEFKNYNRENQFSENGLKAIFEYIEEFENDTKEEYELDVIELCCEFAEYEDFDEIINEYNLENEEDVWDATTVIEFDDGVIIRKF